MTWTRYSCRRQFIAFCIFILTEINPFVGNAQTLTCNTIGKFSSGKSSLDKEISSCISPPFIYYFMEEDWNSETHELKIYAMNTSTSIRDTFTIEIPESVIINSMPTVSLSDDYLILTDDENLDIYRYQKIKGEFLFRNKVELPARSNGGSTKFINKNLVLLESFYNYHPDDKLFNTNLGIYDAAKDHVLKFIHPDLPCIGFSHLEHSWVGIGENIIAVANPCGYKILLYDFNLTLIDSIDFRPGNNWIDLPGNKIPTETNPAKINPKLLIDKLLPLQDTISRIEKIFFVDNSTLLVSSLSKNSGRNQRRIDLFKTGKWKKPYFTEPNAKIDFDSEDSISIDKLPLFLNHPVNIEIKNKTIYTLNSEDFQPTKNSSVKEFNHLKDLYYEKYDPKFSVILYKINTP